MDDSIIPDEPKMYSTIKAQSEEIGFTMPSDLLIGTLLKTLVSSKPQGNFLEMGTGMGLSLSWMIDGMDEKSNLITVDNDRKLIDIARENFGKDKRVKIVCADGREWINNYEGDAFDLIFADAWPGKYSERDETLSLLKIGGFYVVDDMSVQPNWPAGHEQYVNQLIRDLESRKNLNITKMDWSTGIIIATKK